MQQLNDSPVNCFSLHTRCFFPAAAGVMTLAFQGFPEGVVTLKQQLEFQNPHLSPEGMGSKWPKVTFAAVRDEVAPLSLQQLQQLRTLCVEYANRSEGPNATSGACPHFHTLSVVEFQNRALSEVLQRWDCRCTTPCAEAERGVAVEPANAESVEYTDGVVGQLLASAADVADYHARFVKELAPGNNTSSHYLVTCPPQGTLVAFLRDNDAGWLDHIS